MADDATSKEVQTATDTDIFQTLQKVNQSLLDVLQSKIGTNDISYVQQVPVAAPASGGPNYLLWVGVGLGALLLLRKGKIL